MHCTNCHSSCAVATVFGKFDPEEDVHCTLKQLDKLARRHYLFIASDFYL